MEKLYGNLFNFGLIHYEWPTALFMLIVFFVVAFFLHIWLYKPIFAVIQKRKDNVQETKKALHVARKNLFQLEGELNLQEQKIAQEVRGLYAKGLNEGRKEAESILQKGKQEVEQQIEKFDQQLIQNYQEAKEEAMQYIQALSQKVYEHII